MTTKKSAPLQTKREIVKSVPKPPAPKLKLEYFQFDAFVEAARILLMRIDTLMEKGGKGSWARDDLQHWYGLFARGREAFEREELYCERKTARQDLTGCWTKREISRRVVAEKVGLLLGSFPNAAPHNAESYVGMMIEEIIAANPAVSVLEATCRKIRRTKTYAPTISEVLSELREQAKWWGDCLQVWEDDIEYWLKDA
jgi:hypothetical protein